MKIVFFGTPEFSVIIFEALINRGYAPVLVVTATDKPVGRNRVISPPPIKLCAQKHQIKVLQPKKLEEIEPILDSLKPDLIIVAAYGPPFLTSSILKYNCLNVHPSLLPKYRGASPIPSVILEGEQETGVTIIKMTEKIDEGDIVAQEKTGILPTDTTLSLTPRLAELGAELLIKTIVAWLGNQVVSKAQGESSTPSCRQLTKELGRINWNKQAVQIERQIRAYDPWPGTFTILNGKILKIIKGYVTDKEEIQPRPGFVFLSKDGKLAVQTTKAALVIETIQPEGKRPMPGTDFLKGHPDIINVILD